VSVRDEAPRTLRPADALPDGPEVPGNQRGVKVVDLLPERLQSLGVGRAGGADQLASSSVSSSGKRSRIAP
jgi:hypothetical protein